MAKLVDTFRTPEARVQKAIVAIDLTESTKMKEQQPEASWLTTYGWFFDMLTETVFAQKGQIVKYLGDGLMAVFAEDDATNAVNWAIVVQEQMASARAKNLVNCSCSIGIGFGEVVEFDSPMGGKDYIGSVVDRAFRLCSKANANAIFVDTNTVAAASMTKITSQAGRSVAKRRTADEYQGPAESIRLEGFSSPVSYHEVLWENSRFSVKPQVATELSKKPGRIGIDKKHKGPVVGGPVERPQWSKGKVTQVGHKFGFITGPNDEQFWFNQDYLFSIPAQARHGDDVWFIPAEPVGEAKNRRATEVLPFRAVISGQLNYVHPEGYGFATCQAKNGNVYSIFVNLVDSTKWKTGSNVSFDVGENPKGIAGYNPRAQE